MTSPVSTIHPNVVDENVMALTVVRSQLAWDSTHGANVVGIRLAVNVDLATECPGELS